MPYSGTTEFPLWNAANQGPDLIDPYQSRNVHLSLGNGSRLMETSA